MKLIEALELLARPATVEVAPLKVALACGCEPLHLRTFLAAHLRNLREGGAVEVTTGLFGDLAGNVERGGASGADAIAVVVEWSDLDPRLGLRRLGGWTGSARSEIAAGWPQAISRLEGALSAAARSRRVIVCPPTLAPAPLFHQSPLESGQLELELRSAALACWARLAGEPNVRIASIPQLDVTSAPAGRADAAGELSAGFPYSLAHASALAQTLATLICAAAPRKGLITDLDDTLWSGLAGEAGSDAVTWSAERHAHRHAVYQQMLASLADSGVLVGAVSRNTAATVQSTLARADLVLPASAIWPVETGWGPKAEAIGRVLAAWNVAAGDVVLVDDDPLELDAARAAHPDLETVRFPASDDRLPAFLADLRRLFGRSGLTAEDRLRSASLRAASKLRDDAAAAGVSQDEFLAGVGGSLTFSSKLTARASELISKTNQFNLNGRRLSEAALGKALADGRELLTVAYEDRYGPLGTVAAVLVAPRAPVPVIESWVMSCRAFARRIEHETLAHLFERLSTSSLALAYSPTPRNEPVARFLAELTGAAPSGEVLVTREDLLRRGPARVHEASRDEQ